MAGGTARKPMDSVVAGVSLALFVVAWAAAAGLAADPAALPGPARVLEVVVAETRTGNLPYHILVTLLRVAAAFALATAAGGLLGMALGRYRGLDRWLDPWVVLFLNIPALIVIVLCYLWIGLNETAVVVSVAVNKAAMVAVTMREGVRAMDPQVSEMARVYRLGRWTRLRHVVLPQLAPFMSTAVRNGIAIIWKLVLVAEFLGRGEGVGFRIHLYFSLFDTAAVLAYSLSFIAVMLAIEYALLQPWERRANRWRRPAAATP